MKLKEGFIRITESKSRTFLVFCFCFLVGITVASLTEKTIPFEYLCAILVSGAVSAVLWKNLLGIRLIFISLVCLVLGLFRYQLAFPKDTKGMIHVYAGSELEFIGFVSAEPDIRTDGIRYRIRAEQFVEDDEQLDGEVYVKSELYPRYRYGERLVLRCQIEKPEPIEDVHDGTVFRYDRYLSRLDIYALCKNPLITSTGNIVGNVLYRIIFSFKSSLAEKISQIWHEPYASFVAGLLYGYRGGLGSLNELFAITGVTHIVAISGYNITIISTIFITLCKAVYIPRKKAFWIVVSGITLFVIFTGASASVVRAGIMGIMVLIARQSGRKSGIGNVLVITAVVMAIQNPFVLIWDAGFQLSFLATAGLVYLSPIVNQWFVKIPAMYGLKETLSATFSAIIATLPLILFQFGRLSVVAVVVNMLILWLIPWIMIVGAVSVVSAYIALPVGRSIGLGAYIGMEYIIQVVRFFAGMPYASFDIRISWYSMLGAYLLLTIYIRKHLNTRAV